MEHSQQLHVTPRCVTTLSIFRACLLSDKLFFVSSFISRNIICLQFASSTSINRQRAMAKSEKKQAREKKWHRKRRKSRLANEFQRFGKCLCVASIHNGTKSLDFSRQCVKAPISFHQIYDLHATKAACFIVWETRRQPCSPSHVIVIGFYFLFKY